jgi:aryl sulfotransferase
VGRTIEWMRDERYGTSAGRRRLFDQLRQRLRTWSGHVLSWVDQTAIPAHVMRYEDMHARPVETFGAALRFAGVECVEERLRGALERSSFENLRQLEKTAGFAERPAGVEAFFRKGQAGGWREALDQGQVEQVVRDHETVMRRFGYLDADGAPTF